MQKKILTIWLIIPALGFITGMLCNELFPFLYLLMGTALAIILTIIGFIIDLIARSNRGITLTGFIFIFFLTATVTSFAGMKIAESSATKVSNKVILALNNYKRKTGQFPKNIDQLQLDDKTKSTFTKDQHYWTDSSMQQFEIRGWSNGWNVKTFRSSDSTWFMND